VQAQALHATAAAAAAVAAAARRASAVRTASARVIAIATRAAESSRGEDGRSNITLVNKECSIQQDALGAHGSSYVLLLEEVLCYIASPNKR
jgi:hypothetical protein